MVSQLPQHACGTLGNMWNKYILIFKFCVQLASIIFNMQSTTQVHASATYQKQFRCLLAQRPFVLRTGHLSQDFLIVINGFTQSYLCGLYCTRILAKWVHNMDILLCLYSTPKRNIARSKMMVKWELLLIRHSYRSFVSCQAIIYV